MNPLGFVKAHPVATGAVIIGAVVVFFVVGNMTGGGAQASSGGSAATDDASAGAALQAAQLAASAQAGQIASQERVALDNNATAKAIAEINAQVQGQGIDASKEINLHQIDAQASVANTANTLSAQTQINAQNQQTAQIQSANATIQAQSQALAQTAQQKNNNDFFGGLVNGIFNIFGF